MVKNLPEMRETWVLSLGREDPLEKERSRGETGRSIREDLTKELTLDSVSKDKEGILRKPEKGHSRQKE